MLEQQIHILIQKCISGEATLEDRLKLIELAGDNSHKTIFENSLDRIWEEVKVQPVFRDAEQERLLEYILAKEPTTANKETDRDLSIAHPIIHRVHFLKTAWFRYAAAIILIVGLGTAAYLWNTGKKDDQSLANGNKQLQADIPPGGEKAILTLADGSKIILDSAANGSLAQQGNAQVVKLANGQIAYNLKGLAEGAVMMNTMSTPNGGQYRLTLPDGTKVWLNAASSITYPAVFVGKQRNVKIEGEVYFEVAKNKQKPFIIDIDGKSTVQVLGTSFNINSYENEADIKTTLVEGSIKLFGAGTSGSRAQFAILKPGQQAIVASSASISVISNADTEKALAWKKGWFNFNGLDLKAVMRQLERWYDIKVQYEGNIPEVRFRGEMDKGVSLSEILNIFSSLDFQIKARLEGRTLIISGN
jgi:transmembrane sensor